VTVDLDVGAVAHGGVCVARHEGRVVFVRHALPGERVRARITEERSRYARADAVEVLAASPDRVVPPCPFAGPGRCGGCDWQHASLDAQRRLKAAVVREQLARLARLDWSGDVAEVPGAPGGLGWRTRVRFAVTPDGAVGFRRHRSHDVQPIDHCQIAHPLVEAAGVEGRRWPGAIAIEVAAGATSGETAVVVEGPGATDVAGDVAAVVHERAGGRRWRVSAGGFWQVHPGAADTLLAAVLDLADPQPAERALDLYAGVGLFAAGLAERVGAAGRVIAVEGDRGAVTDARDNLADLPQVRVRRASVTADVVRRLAPADVVALDPPRTGAGADVVRAIGALGPRAVVYVACDPAALARDLATFASAGYAMRELRAYDLFPMTAHVECVALLQPVGPST
jgi:tRNA/tmRNA/rRNA uracil-C5-methylase (TrmA/RlmC/RlmD family)